MVNYIPITAPKGATYLSQFMDELPVNCLFNKGVTGCGGTELALRDNNDTIIAMPTIALVKNKSDNREDILGVYSEIKEQDIKDYISTHQRLKIILTYNALPRVVEILKSMGINIYTKVRLLVDEYHLLFNQYVFRNECIRDLLVYANKFKRVTYMTATPIEEEYILEELKHIPVCKVVWSNIRQVTVYRQPVSNCINYVLSVMKNKLENKTFGNCHFFVNSVNFIKKCLNKSNINPSDVKIVCAENEENIKKLDGYNICKPSDMSCKINFYTSTCFEGCDIFDKEGKTYIVSDGNNPNTLYDISTLFIQIIGRLRDSEYKYEVEHIYTKSRYDGDVSYEEYRDMILEEFDKSVIEIERYNSKNESLRRALYKRYGKEDFENRFIYIAPNFIFKTDKNLLNKSLQDYKLKTHIYNDKVNLVLEYHKNNLKCIDKKYYCSDRLKSDISSKTRFKDAIIEYNSYRLEHGNSWIVNHDERCKVLEKKYNFIRHAYDNLGMDRIIELNYNTTRIKRDLVKLSYIPYTKKITKIIVSEIGLNRPIQKKVIKEKLQSIYNHLGLSIKAVSTDIDKYFIVKSNNRIIELIKEKSHTI